MLLCASTAEFSIWTREAGAGGLSIAVEGPSKAEIAFEDHKDGSCGVSYIVQEPGTQYKCTEIKLKAISKETKETHCIFSSPRQL